MRSPLGKLTLVALFTITWWVPARALELNHYFAGLLNVDDFFLPPPEVGQLIYAQYNAWYRTDTFRNFDGDAVDSITITGPLGQPRTIDLDFDIDNFYLAPALMWAPKWHVLGGRYGAFAALPIGNPSVAAALDTRIGRGASIDESSWGVGDLFVQPLWFMWSFPRIDVTAAYGFDAPTGKYEGGAADNVGLGFWEHQIQSALRYHFDEAKTWGAIASGTFEFGQTNKEDADIVPGTHFTLNWGVRRNFLGNWLQFAVLGYDTWQSSEDRGDDVSSNPKDEVHAAGLQLGVPKLGLAVKYLHEFEAEDRFEGQVRHDILRPAARRDRGEARRVLSRRTESEETRSTLVSCS